MYSSVMYRDILIPLHPGSTSPLEIPYSLLEPVSYYNKQVKTNAASVTDESQL
jgi:hypothetical protein